MLLCFRLSTLAAVARLYRIWQCNTISFANEFKLYKAFITFILLCGDGTWTLLDDSERKTQALETKCLRKFLCISYLEHKTNYWVCMRSKLNFLVGPQEPLLTTVKRGLHGSGMSHATTASPKPSFMASWRVGDAVVGRENAGLTTSKSGHPCPCQNGSQGLQKKRLIEDLC